jgi:hypothetical protein
VDIVATQTRQQSAGDKHAGAGPGAFDALVAANVVHA